MIKFLSLTISVLFADVVFLYYLVNNSNFIPFNTDGSLNIVNFIILVIGLVIGIFCLISLIIFAIRNIFIKQHEVKANIVLTIRLSALISLGLLIVFLLHFFHIVNFIWGMSILLVVILSIFII